MSFSPSSPPPPLPSPLLVPTPLPSPPPLAKSHRSHPSPIPPPRRAHHHALSYDAFRRAPGTPHVNDAPRAEHRRRPASSPRTIKRTLSQLPSRCRSPPPTPPVRSPPPPVPPIPAFALTTNHSFIRSSRRPSAPSPASAFDLYLDHHKDDTPNMCCESQAGHGGALTCVQFVAVHNPTGQCHS